MLIVIKFNNKNIKTPNNQLYKTNKMLIEQLKFRWIQNKTIIVEYDFELLT